MLKDMIETAKQEYQLKKKNVHCLVWKEMTTSDDEEKDSHESLFEDDFFSFFVSSIRNLLLQVLCFSLSFLVLVSLRR